MGKMVSSGVVRRVDELGRVTLPVELRRTLDIAEKDSLEILVEGESIVLRKFQKGCIFCGEISEVIEYKGKLVCESCRKDMK